MRHDGNAETYDFGGALTPMCNSNRVRVEALAERALRARGSFLPPESPPDSDRATEYLRDGVGPAIALFRESSMEGKHSTLSPSERQTLDRALNDWLELYAACYGIYIEAAATASEAAALVDDGRTLQETAARLTGVPGVVTVALHTQPKHIARSGSRPEYE